MVMNDFTSNKTRDESLLGQLLGRRGVIESHSPPHPTTNPNSPDLTSLDFYLWGALKNIIYLRGPATLMVLQEETETACASIPLETLGNLAQAVVHCTHKCLDALNNHLEHLL